jgi:hypothetical protein
MGRLRMLTVTREGGWSDGQAEGKGKMLTVKREGW